MALTTAFSGTEAIGATEWSLCTDTGYDSGDLQTAAGTYVLVLDVADMVAGDELRILAKRKTRSTDTVRDFAVWTLAGVQGTPGWMSPAIPMQHGWDFTLLAVSGTITVNWSIEQLDG